MIRKIERVFDGNSQHRTARRQAMKTMLTIFLTVCSTLFAVAASAKDGLIAHWSFDEGNSTNIFDSSGNGWNGILEDRPLPVWTNGLSGTGLSFAAGRDQIPNFNNTEDKNNIKMDDLKRGLYQNGGWSWGDNRWHHSDIKKVAYPFNYGAFDRIVTIGTLNQ
jgi:hypothetical protein